MSKIIIHWEMWETEQQHTYSKTKLQSLISLNIMYIAQVFNGIKLMQPHTKLMHLLQILSTTQRCTLMAHQRLNKNFFLFVLFFNISDKSCIGVLKGKKTFIWPNWISSTPRNNKITACAQYTIKIIWQHQMEISLKN